MTTTATDKLSTAMANTGTDVKPGMSLQMMLRTDTIKTRFESMLGKKSAGFLSSILSAQQMNNSLVQAEPLTIISAAAIAASLDLPINPSLGMAYIVPYKGKATFQIGWKGMVQLGMRSGQYRTMNVTEVYEGELVKHDRFTGIMEFDEDQRKSEKVIGYLFYFKLLNGFEKWTYMTVEQLIAHGKKFSQAYKKGFGPWVDDFPAMCKKTVVKLGLSKWGVMSIEMQKAVVNDVAVIDEAGNPNFIDSTSSPLAPADDPKNAPESPVSEKKKPAAKVTKTTKKTAGKPAQAQEKEPKKEEPEKIPTVTSKMIAELKLIRVKKGLTMDQFDRSIKNQTGKSMVALVEYDQFPGLKKALLGLGDPKK